LSSWRRLPEGSAFFLFSRISWKRLFRKIIQTGIHRLDQSYLLRSLMERSYRVYILANRFRVAARKKQKQIPRAKSARGMTWVWVGGHALVHCRLRCRRRMNRYTNHSRPQHPPVVQIPSLKYLQNRAVRRVFGLCPVYRLVLMRIKWLPRRLDALHAEFRQIVQHLLVNQLKTLAIIFVLRLAMRCQRVFKTVHNRNQRLHDARRRPLAIV